MNLTSRQKWCLGILGLAVVALGVDQVIGPGLPGPESAGAAQDDLLISADRAPTPTGERAPASRPSSGVRLLTVRQQLEALRSAPSQLPPESGVIAGASASLPDAFGMSRAMAELVHPPKPVTMPDGQTQAPVGPDRPNLRTDLKLTSILSFREPGVEGSEPEGREAVAIIEGRACRVGDVLHGWVVREITPRSVLLEEEGDWTLDGGARVLRLELRDRSSGTRS